MIHFLEKLVLVGRYLRPQTKARNDLVTRRWQVLRSLMVSTKHQTVLMLTRGQSFHSLRSIGSIGLCSVPPQSGKMACVTSSCSTFWLMACQRYVYVFTFQLNRRSYSRVLTPSLPSLTLSPQCLVEMVLRRGYFDDAMRCIYAHYSFIYL